MITKLITSKNLLLLIAVIGSPAPILSEEPDRNTSWIDAGIGVELVTMVDPLVTTAWLSAFAPVCTLSFERGWIGSARHNARVFVSFLESNRFRANNAELEEGEYRVFQLAGGVEYHTLWGIGQLFSFSHGVAFEPGYTLFEREVSDGAKLVQHDIHVNLLTLLGVSMVVRERLHLGGEVQLGIGLPIYGTIDYPGALDERTRTLVIRGGGAAQVGLSFDAWRVGVLYLKQVQFRGTFHARDNARIRSYWLQHGDRVSLEIGMSL